MQEESAGYAGSKAPGESSRIAAVTHSYKLSIRFKVALVLGLPGAALRISWVLVTPAMSDPVRKLMMLQCRYQPPLVALPGETFCLKTIFASKMLCGFSLQDPRLTLLVFM